MPSVKYTGTFLDHSGYGSANRNFIAALHTARVEVTTELVIQVAERAIFGWTGELAKALLGRKVPYKIKIIHLTPDMYPNYMEAGKYHIGHLFWETDRLPKEWVEPCNRMNEIWTASEPQAQMIRDSGVVIPVYAIPQAIDLYPAQKIIDPYILPNFDGMVFYSIFQWIERKNPRALVVNFWKAFEGIRDVALVIKAHGFNYSEAQFEKIRQDVKQWKSEVPLLDYPRVYWVKKLLTTDEIYRLHRTGDCYVNTSRGEGWCIPAVEAAMMGNPVISIDKTGFADYFSKEEEIFYPCSTSIDKVKEVPSIPWYTVKQNWLEISAADLVNQMRSVYNSTDTAKKRGKKAQKFVAQNFNYLAVGNLMSDRLKEIEKSL